MGDPPDRGTGGLHVRGNGMIRRTQAPKTPSSRPPLRRRRRPVMPMVRRAARWSGLLALAGLAYGGFALSRSPDRDVLLAEAADRVVAATASLGLVVEDVEVEGRETTDSSMIMTALAARRGASILAVDLWRAKAELEKLPWVRSAAIERRLPRTLHVRLSERRPLPLWEHAGKQHLVTRPAAAGTPKPAPAAPAGGGDPARRLDPLRPPAAGRRRYRRRPRRRAGRDA